VYPSRIVKLADVDSGCNISSKNTGTITVQMANHEHYYLPEVARGAALSILAGDRSHQSTRNGTWNNTIIQGVTRRDLDNRKYVDHRIYHAKDISNPLSAKALLTVCMHDVTPRMIEIIDNLIGWSDLTRTIVAKCDYEATQVAWEDIQKLIDDAYVGDKAYISPTEALGMANMIILLGVIMYVTKKRED
jgi:hypothetical protein